MKSAMRIWTCLDGFTTHFTTNTTNTTQPYRIPTTTCAMKFSPCLFLHGSCSGLQHAVRNRYSGFCWPRLFPEVGWYGKTCLNSLLNLVDGFFTHFTTNTSSTTQPHRIPANNLHNAIFTMFVLAWILSCFQAC